MPFAAGVCCDGDNCEPVLGCRGAFHSNVSTLYEPQNGGCVGRTVQEGALGHGPSVVVLGGKCNGVRPRFSVFFGGVVYLQRRKKILYTLLLFTSRVNFLDQFGGPLFREMAFTFSTWTISLFFMKKRPTSIAVSQCSGPSKFCGTAPPCSRLDGRFYVQLQP